MVRNQNDSKKSTTSEGRERTEAVFVTALVCRFRALNKDYLNSIANEFLPSDDTCNEWQGFLFDLQWALSSIIDERPGIGSDLGGGNSNLDFDKLILDCDGSVSRAISILSGPNDTGSAGERIADAVEQLKLMDYSLHCRQLDLELLRAEYSGVSLRPLSGALDAEERYKNAFSGLSLFIDGNLEFEHFDRLFSRRLRLAEGDISNKPELVACTISRLAFLWASMFAFMSPREWIGGTRLDRLLELHERLRSEKLLTPSPYRYNIGHRIHQIKNSKLLTGTVFG